MTYFDDPWRSLAKAARQRDWATIDAILDDRLRLGNVSVMRGFGDARLEAGEEVRTKLETPDPVLISDLPSREGIEVYDELSPKWRRKEAA